MCFLFFDHVIYIQLGILVYHLCHHLSMYLSATKLLFTKDLFADLLVLCFCIWEVVVDMACGK